MVAIPDKQQQNIKLSALEWIIGAWHNEGDNVVMEEYWYPELGDTMPGWFII